MSATCYVKRFLLNTQTNFIQEMILYAQYQALKRVAHDFRRDQTQIIFLF